MITSPAEPTMGPWISCGTSPRTSTAGLDFCRSQMSVWNSPTGTPGLFGCCCVSRIILDSASHESNGQVVGEVSGVRVAERYCSIGGEIPILQLYCWFVYGCLQKTNELSLHSQPLAFLPMWNTPPSLPVNLSHLDCTLRLDCCALVWNLLVAVFERHTSSRLLRASKWFKGCLLGTLEEMWIVQVESHMENCYRKL